ncbi:MAG: EAL domain-containing protein [Xanthobacteraceae bacterium]|uniref:EAL domain-containing protein n=1 Tax=Pseudolabrys sp. TaxID=1960880 RepID=UPI003D105FF7
MQRAKASEIWTRWRPGMSGRAAFFNTIRGRILIAFLVMSAITGALGLYTTQSTRDTGLLVEKTFDRSLMSINYARAAATDFAAMRAAFARLWIASEPETRAKLEIEIQRLARTLNEDLDIAAQRSQSERATQAAQRVARTVEVWKTIRERLLDTNVSDANWESLDRYADKVNEQIDLLINYTAGDGFIYRQTARATVARDVQLNFAGTLLAIFLSAIVTWLLARRIVGPVAAASNIAGQIARGKLDVVIPKDSSDELGTLLDSMGIMRDNIKAAMEREVGLRQSAQSRLSDALENSQKGVVLVDANDRIVLANGQAAAFFRVSQSLFTPGMRVGEVREAIEASAGAGRLLTRPDYYEPGTEQIKLNDGRWLNVSQSLTRDGGFIVVCGDVTETKRQEEALRATNLRLDAALDNMTQGLSLFDAEGRLEVINRRYLEIFGLTRDMVGPGATFLDLLELSVAAGNHPGKTAQQVMAEQHEFLRTSPTGMRLLDISGRVISCVYRPTQSGGFVATYEDVTERQQAETKIMHMARHDALTNLPNRVLFRETMEAALASGDKLAVLFLDLDRFKSVNDTLGHPVGDALLCEVTRRLQLTVRGADTVARLGGDEFAIIQMGGIPGQATDLAVRIIEAISEPFDIMGHQVVIGTSVGIAVAPTDGNEPDQLLRNADMALYRAKSDGRGTYHFFHPEMDSALQARRSLELDLRKALGNGEFELYYQPIVKLETGVPSGFEALLRWRHPEHGLVSPDKFIPIAEEIGVIVSIGDWVLKQACLDAAAWPDNLSVAVNLSAVQFRSPTLALSVVSALGTSGLAPGRLELEITETVLLQDDKSVLDTLHQMRDLGVKISMDDFGTGYSSLSYLRSFPFDKIKIDRSFINELGKKEDCVAIIRAVSRLGLSLGMITTAEGVETKEQLDILRAEGCTQGQGYYFSPPRPVSEVPAILKKLKPRTRAA